MRANSRIRTGQSRRGTAPWQLLPGLLLLAACLGLTVQAQTTPKISLVAPAKGATGVALTTPIVFTFDQAMAPVPAFPSVPPFVVGNIELEPADSVPSVDAEWSADGRTLTCTPSDDWPASTVITWKLNPAGTPLPFTSQAGTALATTTGTFTTGTGGGGGGGDEPALSTSNPANGALNVAVTTSVTFVFDRPMTKIAIPGDAIGWSGTGLDSTKFSYGWSGDGLSLVCDYAGDLPAGTLIGWALNRAASVTKLTSATGVKLPDDTYAGGFLTATGGGGGDCDPDGIPSTWGNYSISKQARYVQTSTSDPTPTVETPVAFGAYVAAPPGGPTASAGSVTLPNGTAYNLTAGPVGGYLFYNAMPASESALNTAYPSGGYTLRFTPTGQAQRVIPMTMPAFSIPVPKLGNYTAAQSVNAGQDFTLTWNSFTGAAGDDRISLMISDAQGKVVFQAPDLCVPRQLAATATSILLPAKTLASNQTYTATIAFQKVFYASTNTVPQMAGYGALMRETEFTIKTGTGGTGTAARFTAFRLLPNGNPELELTGAASTIYTIQRSGSLATPNWTTVGAATTDAAGKATFQDTQSGKTFPLFYRAVSF